MKLDMNKRTGALLIFLVVLTLYVFRPAETVSALAFMTGFVQGFWESLSRQLGMTPEMLFSTVFWLTVLFIGARKAAGWIHRRRRAPSTE